MITQFNTDAKHQTIQLHTLYRHIDRLEEAGFTYLGGYENNKSNMLIRCNCCGTIRTITGDYLGRKQADRQYKITCNSCKDKQRAEQKEHKKAHKKALQRVAQTIKAVEKAKKKSFAFICVCNQCGRTFESKRKGVKYCSDECRRKKANSYWRVREDRIRNVVVDKDITLEKLYSKYNGVCYLCGKKCDWDDYKTIRGTFIAGNQYPSIEHVKPLSKGGVHEWANVKLAHRLCNTLKGNR